VTKNLDQGGRTRGRVAGTPKKEDAREEVGGGANTKRPKRYKLLAGGGRGEHRKKLESRKLKKWKPYEREKEVEAGPETFIGRRKLGLATMWRDQGR